MRPSGTTIAKLRRDPRNPRRHPSRNLALLVDALQEVGTARSIVIDEDGTILAGNGVADAATQAGLDKVQIVESDGATLIAVRRRGLSPAQKTRLALFDNRTSELAEWDPEVLAALADEGALEGMFYDDELARILEAMATVEGAEEVSDSAYKDLRSITLNLTAAQWEQAHRVLGQLVDDGVTGPSPHHEANAFMHLVEAYERGHGSGE